MTQLVSRTLLDEAFHHICTAKKDAHFNNDIWFTRRDWLKLRRQLQTDLLAGNYLLSSAKLIKKVDHSILMWSSLDAIVLKALSLLLERTIYPKLSIYQRCYHTKGKGLKTAIKVISSNAKSYSFVYKTDIRQYYASLDRHKIQELFGRWIKDKRMLSLLWQYCERIEDVNGCYLQRNRGVPKGGPLSIVIGTLYLVDLDALSDRPGLKYLRYLDDIIIFCKTRGLLRKIIKAIYKILENLQLTLAKSKTYIGRVNKGFDFLGYRIGEGLPDTITISKTTVQRFYQRLQQLYEQRASIDRVAAYKKRWYQWVIGGLSALCLEVPIDILYLIHNPIDGNICGPYLSALQITSK